MIGIHISTVSLLPGLDKEKKQLSRLLNRAAALSERLRVEIGEQALGPQLALVAGQLEEMIAYQKER